MNKALLPMFWIIAIGSLGLLSSLLKLESTHFLGIADNHEQTISFSYPVEIVKTYAVEGGEVQQGSEILEVRRRDLGTKLVIIEDQIQALKSTAEQELASTQAKLAGLRAQQAAELASIDSEIKNLRSQQRLNKQLLNEISGVKTSVNTASPIETEIQGKLELRGHIIKTLAAQIKNLENQLSVSKRPIDSKLAELEERRTEFIRQVTALKVVAQFNGRVGSVNHKRGEVVAPFQPILTVHGHSPKFIKGYIHEYVFNQVAVGQRVWVRSNTNSSNSTSISAIVESLGSRIVEYPVRLKKNLMVSAWGREAVVRLVDENSLLMGEKVTVILNDPDNEQNLLSGLLDLISSSIGQTQAAGLVENSYVAEGRPIRSMVAGIVDRQIEASGIISSKIDESFYIVSDESENYQPALFKLNARGELIARIKIDFDKKIDDLESISQEDDHVYVMASLDGKKSRRHRMLRLRLKESQFVVDGHINIYQLLKSLSVHSEDGATRRFLKLALQQKSIELESHQIYRNDLYLGFKTPLNSQDETVILKLDNAQDLFEGRPPKGRIWRSISLLNPQTGSPALLSDMLFLEDSLLLLGVSQDAGSHSSHLWSYDLNTSSLLALQSFEELKAEGVGTTSTGDELIVVFDGGGKAASRYTTLAL